MKKAQLQEKIEELTWELTNANRCIASKQRTARDLRAELEEQRALVARLIEYGEAMNIRQAAAHRELTAPLPEVKPTHKGGSPANIPGYYIKGEVV